MPKSHSKTQVVILCGGKGTRLREQTEEIPKPLVEIGGMPILWHIMKSYDSRGFKDFILCLGYKGEKIKDFFVNFHYRSKDDFDLIRGVPKTLSRRSLNDVNNWNVTFAETGLETNTGGRIKKIEKYITGDTFFTTYGDGLSGVNFNEQLKYHKSHKKIATMTCVQPKSQFGVVEIGAKNLVQKYLEKPQMRQWVNGGFFVFDKEIFSLIHENDVLEQEPMGRLETRRQIVAYPFKGFWACMDTYKDAQTLNELWSRSAAPWKTWND